MHYLACTRMRKEEINMVVRPDKKIPVKNLKDQYVFLAGSIDFKSSSNWREEVICKVNHEVIFFDPTNHEHDTLDDSEMKNQINWELEALELSNKILLNFLPNYESPISLVELGLYTFTRKLIVVCPKQFHKYRYVSVLCERYNIPFFLNLNDAIAFLRKELIEF